MKLPGNPNEMNECFAEAYNSGKIENLTVLFETQAQGVTMTGSILSGIGSIKEDLEKLLLLGGRMTSVNRYAVQQGDIALLRADWTITAKGNPGDEIQVKGSSSEVVRRQANGTWLYVIDHPFGASPDR